MISPDYKISTDPASEPLTTAEAKTHLRVAHSDDDTYIDSLIKMARTLVEEECNRALITQTWEGYLQDFPGSDDDYEIMINKCPVSSVSSIQYYDSDNSLQTLSTDYYEAYTEGEPAIIRLKYNQSWPSVYDRKKAIIITFVTGSANAAAVPQPLKNAMLMIIGHYYENRQDVITGMSVNEVPMASRALMAPYKLMRYDI